ncbi:unnamed protein product [Adineta steineri]|uniref:Uncharacterized protein n=1 Tax=Adineta steineri TaxID=433720 RepID=A0A814DV31_9BILA|nr:unnamed protein product [Adineta steineri]CAF3948966.1 unnamed protein product [Adineta steineri]
MKLENVNVDKLQLTDLPKFNKCPCELCDDGCFDRAGYEHHPDCKRLSSRRDKLALQFPCPISHYKDTFQVQKSASGKPIDHRRKICSPAPENEIPISFKNSPMAGMTSQRDHYQPPPRNSSKNAPTRPIKQKNNVMFIRTVPMETKSSYQAEYIEKPIKAPVLHAVNTTGISNVNSDDPALKMSSTTTSGTYFKSWHSPPSEPYTEAPSIVGNLLFPDSSRNFSTSSGSVFVPHKNVSKTKSLRRLETRGNLRQTGSVDLSTSYRDSYIPHEYSPRSAPFDRKGQLNEDNAHLHRKMDSISQTSTDFRAYPNHRPPLPVEGDPFLSQITIGNSTTPRVMASQYRADYEGIDTSRHHRPPAVAPRDAQKLYMKPLQKMESLTVTKRDFQPLDVSSMARMRAISMKDALPKDAEHIPMENMTTSRYYYHPHELLKSNRQYGEPVPEVYMPPTTKFDGSTTNRDTYKGQQGKRANAFVPELRGLRHTGKQDLTTNYRTDYHSHGLTLCAARAYAIAQQKQTNSAPISAQ